MFCLILGEKTEASFLVKLSLDDKVMELKESIIKTSPVSFTGIDAKDISLYHVDISDEDIERMEKLNTKPPSDINIEQELGGEKMNPRKNIKLYFTKEPNDEHIHIIIVKPLDTISKCLPTFYLSNKTFAVTKYQV
jgi:hypothetical protein